MAAWNGSREPFTATISRVKGTGSFVPRVVRYAVFPSRTMASTLSITSSSAWGRLQGRREAYCTRPPQLWRAPTMSWLRSTSIFAGSCGFSRKYLGWLDSSFTHQKRMSRRGRGIRPSLMSRLRARPISSMLAQPLPSSLAEVVSWMCAVSTICWSWISLPWIQASTIACSGRARYSDSMSTLTRKGPPADCIWRCSLRPRRGEIITANVDGVPSFTPSTPRAS